MGVKGGGRNLHRNERRWLEDVAKRTFREKLEPQKRNVFISFVEEDLAEVNLLRGQAKNENSSIQRNMMGLIL